MEDSRKLLERHEINLVRVDLKENPANMIWLWGQGKKPTLPKFIEKFGITGSVISAVDLIKGMVRICQGLACSCAISKADSWRLYEGKSARYGAGAAGEN